MTQPNFISFMKKIFFLLLFIYPILSKGQIKSCDECWTKFNQNGYTEALHCFSESIQQLKKFDICRYYGRAYSYYKLLKYEEAKRDIDTAIAKYNPARDSKSTMGNMYFLLARINSKEDQKEIELKNLYKSLGYAETAELFTTIAYALGQIKEYEKAVHFATRAIAMDTNAAFAYSNRALAYIMLEKYDEAMQDLERSIDLNQDNPYAYKHRGILFLKTGHKAAACEEFNEAIRKGYRDFGNEADKGEVDFLIKENCGL